MSYARQRSSNFSGLKLRLLIAAVIVLFSVVSYLSKGQVNPITGEKQRVDLVIKEEILMGLHTAPQMGEESMNFQATHRVQTVGARLVNELQTQLLKQGVKNPFPFDFHLLADTRTVNAFALPGGQVFITEALYNHLEKDGEIAGVLGHEIGHVIERHGAQRMAKGGFFKGLAGAAGVAGGTQGSSQAGAAVFDVLLKSYSRKDELESDRWGIQLMMLAGYSPEHLLSVMDVLEKTSGGGAGPEFMSTHPRPANRREYIKQIIDEKFPNGLPRGLH